MEKKTIIETFRQRLARQFSGFWHPPEAKVIKWDAENKGEGMPPWDGRNVQKRQRRAAAKQDRLAHIRYYRKTLGVTYAVPKMKRVPRVVFE